LQQEEVHSVTADFFLLLEPSFLKLAEMTINVSLDPYADHRQTRSNRMATTIKKWLFTQVFVPDNEVVLIFQKDQLEQVLGAGEHRLPMSRQQRELVVFDRFEQVIKDERVLQLVRHYQSLQAWVDTIHTQVNQLAVLYIDQQLLGVVPPGEQLSLWKGIGELVVDYIDLTGDLAIDRTLMNQLQARGLNAASKLLTKATCKRQPALMAQVAEGHQGILYCDGQLIRPLKPGSYGYWQLNHDVQVRQFDLRVQTLEVGGQEILSKDRVSIRINLSANVRVVDAVLAAQQVDNLSDYLYKTMQLALREAVGTQTLDQLLEDKLYINETIKTLVVQDFSNVGVELIRVGVKDIILPGEIRSILNQVVEAQKAAEANVIKRREETAATRSLNNTAKMMEGNATLLRLKELEALEKMSEKIDRISVYGGLEGLMKGTLQLN
jgi:regulator of protease activity HflC (stomatin/prohibitin superfamily)